MTCGQRCAALAAAAGAALALSAGPAGAAVPFKEIGSAGPLTSVVLGNELSCQVAHAGDSVLELFPSGAKPGDCGTFLAVGDTLFAPDFANHDSTATGLTGSTTPFSPVSQTEVGGQGTTGSPLEVTTVAGAGATGLTITEKDSYVAGQESYRTDVTISNGGGGPVSGILYRAGDCYLQESDTGFGFLDDANKAVGCSINANNSPQARIEQWFPITGGNQFMEAGYSEVWQAIATRQPLPNTTRAGESIDNGAGISWGFSVAPGASATYSHYTTFSPRGIAGPPAPPAPPPAPTPLSPVRPTPAVRVPSTPFGSRGFLETPSNNRCVSRRFFRIKLRKRYWPVVAAVTVRMPKVTRVLRRRPWGTIVDLRGLPKGKFKVRITALTTGSRTIRGTRTYRTCRGKLRGKRPKL
jgi:hypothetical protein